MLEYHSPGDELLSIRVIGFCLLLGSFHLTPVGQKHLRHLGRKHKHDTVLQEKGKLAQKLRCENSSGLLMLLITYFLVSQFITRLEQRKCEAAHELHSRWAVFSVIREMQK